MIKDEIMTQEERDLLRRDLCGRLPYNTKVRYREFHRNGDDEDIVLNVYNSSKLLTGIEIYRIRPYLRPLSDMTEDEARVVDAMTNGVDMVGRESGFEWYGGAIDFLAEHHLDYRGLIKKGLALKAPDGMYDIKQI